VDLRFYLLVIGVLGVWRVTHLLQAEDGPWDIVVRLRGYAGTGMWGRLMDCFYCLSLWIAMPFALLCGEGWVERLVLWPAFSAGAILVERVNGGLPQQPPLAPIEEVVPYLDPQACEKKET
jgi:hypothetical protein